MNLYHRKLYALLKASDKTAPLIPHVTCLKSCLAKLDNWWQKQQTTENITVAESIASSADRLNLAAHANPLTQPVACHPISGQTQPLTAKHPQLSVESLQQVLGEQLAHKVLTEENEETAFLWFWRFAPELAAKLEPKTALLHPAHPVLPDCPVHSYQSTVSAIAGATFSTENGPNQTAYLLVFSFSPVQEFIKASRKFLDFWAGSYLLHYLSAKLCWKIADEYGPDAVIVPSLWSQEIIDALMTKPTEPEIFKETFEHLLRNTPAERFKEKESNSLSTAGFPNVITALVPGKKAAETLGAELTRLLTCEWRKLGDNIKKDIRSKVIKFVREASDSAQKELLAEVFPGLPPQALEAYTGYSSTDGEKKKGELEKLAIQSCWEWADLWEAQLEYAWEPYWSAVPLGHPEVSAIAHTKDSNFKHWKEQQQQIAHSPKPLEIPAEQEEKLYAQIGTGELNVGLWWGSLQRRLQICLQATKNTRTWQIPAAPGERSTISGKFSALHPWLKYSGDFCEGGGLPEGSMRLFWAIMAKAYPGLFNGTERLNAIELTKRMAWSYGSVADDLGIEGSLQPDLSRKVAEEDQEAAEVGEQNKNEYDFETQIRFPNLSSIAAARFLKDCPQLAEKYWQTLNKGIKAARAEKVFSPTARRAFYAKTLSNSQTSSADIPYNGVMFSSKWLADDMGLLPKSPVSPDLQRNPQDSLTRLRQIVDQAHQSVNLTSGSPADWWAIVLADGDNMGQFVSGKKLEHYDKYVQRDALNSAAASSQTLETFLADTRKRMGPATHVGLNRALLDFSNRLVPYLTEQRFCGRVIYSGGDDVMSVLPIEDLPEYLLSLRAAWSGKPDPFSPAEFSDRDSGYWHPHEDTEALNSLSSRPHFTMGKTATMSIGVVIAHKSVPLPTVLESLWDAEGKQAKGMSGKNGLCFRVIYSNGNQLEALMSGSERSQEMSTDLLREWWRWVKLYTDYVRARETSEKLSPLLYRLAEELPQRANVGTGLLAKAARVLIERRDSSEMPEKVFDQLERWIDYWDEWATEAKKADGDTALGVNPEDLGKLLRFSAFWIDKQVERIGWQNLSASIEGGELNGMV